jgi:tRNA threonylcarbamoyladenosine biosynthesis protein TsaE
MNGTLTLADPRATESAGAALSRALSGQAGVVALSGALGAGKTTFVRGLLHALGHAGTVRSPTYTLVEPYAFGDWRVLHLDLYRLAGARDLEALGLRDELDGRTLLVVEWPERAGAALPAPDLAITLEEAGAGRVLRWMTRNAHYAQALEK